MTDVPNLLTEADYKALARSLEQQYVASGMRDMVSEAPSVGSLSAAEQDALRGISDLIFQFGKTFDLSNDDVLSQLSKFTMYLAITRLRAAAQSGPILAAL